MLGLTAPLAQHMALHIAVMNLFAPLVALMLCRWVPRPLSGSLLVLAASIQMALLWGWHLPGALSLAMAHFGAMMAMHATLFASALLFWTAIWHAARRWHALLALIVSAKFFCLLGILFTLSPRLLYGLPGAAVAHHGLLPFSLEDQHLAGLLMLTACPLSYLAVATFLALPWVRERPLPAAVNRLKAP